MELNDKVYELHLKPVTRDLLADRLTIVERQQANGGGRLVVELFDESNSTNQTFQRNSYSEPESIDHCHFHHRSVDIVAAISNCDGNLVRVFEFLKDTLFQYRKTTVTRKTVALERYNHFTKCHLRDSPDTGSSH